VEPAQLVSTAGARPGDLILLTKGIAVEGTALLAREKGAELAGRYPQAFLQRCRDMLHHPGISVVPEARLLRDHLHVHAMHDPTEGGLATALQELAAAAGVGILLESDAVPVLPETEALCREYGLDPLGLISSGALLAALPEEEAEAALAILQKAGIHAAIIGAVTPAGEGLRMRRGGEIMPLPAFPRDEFARLVG